MMFPKFWTQSDIYWSLKSDDSGSYEVRSEMDWLVYCIVWAIGFHLKLTKWLLPQYYDVPQVLDSIRYRLVHNWSTKFDKSGSYEVRSEIEWLLYCMVLEIGFHSKPTKWLLPQYYDVPHVLCSIWYRLVHEIGQFRFVWTMFLNGVVGVLYSSRDWISLKTHQMTPPTILWCSPSFGLNPISIGAWNRTIQVRTMFVLEWIGRCIV